MGCTSSAAKGGDANRVTSPGANKQPLKGVKPGGFSSANFIIENTGKLQQFYDVQTNKLGQGSYGSVSKAQNKATAAVRAVKSISKAHVKNIDRLKQEIQIMKIMDHPHVIKLFETFEDHRYIYLIMELCQGGELFDRIIEAGHFNEQIAATIMQQILRAIFYIHSLQVMHRDLKPENFLFVQPKKEPIERSTLKIIDFGLSKKFEPGQVMTTKAGTPYYVAPQVLSGKYDQACDLWSAGVIMYIMLCGYPPFYGESDPDVLNKVRFGNYTFNAADWRTVSQDAKDLICRLLKMNPRDRYTAKEALDHVWIAEKAPQASKEPLHNNLVDKLNKFRSGNKLKKAALHVIANQMDESQIKQLKSIFMQLDENGDGKLTVEEMRRGLLDAGIKDFPDDLKTILEGLDSDGSGVIDYTEWLAATMDKRQYMQEDVCWAAFRVFDRNGDGKISRQELAEVLANGDLEDTFGKEAIVEILAECDKDGDGEIDFQEFMEMMQSQAK